MHTVQVEEGVWTVHLKSVSHENCAENFNVIQQTDLNMSFAEYLSGVNFFAELRIYIDLICFYKHSLLIKIILSF